VDQSRYRVVAKTSDIEVGRSLPVEVGGCAILVCHIAEGFFAVENKCSHADSKLDGGRIRGSRILCPRHGAAFDLRNGCALSRPAIRPIRCYPLRIDEDDILVAPEE
jgi:nitrite reductase/ring-hydroxylating ferredoxin subunit